MKNELLTIGPFTVYGYGLMIAIGILAGCLTAPPNMPGPTA